MLYDVLLHRQLLVCRVTLGKCAVLTAPERYSHPPPGCNSVYGKAMEGFLDHDEYVIYCDEQVILIRISKLFRTLEIVYWVE